MLTEIKFKNYKAFREGNIGIKPTYGALRVFLLCILKQNDFGL